MLKSKAIRKIFVTTLSLFVLLVAYSLPSLDDTYTLKTNLEIESATGLATDNIYLLNSNGYLVKSRILLESTDLEKKIREILEQLTVEDDNYFPKGLFPYIPQGTEVLNVLCGEKQVSIDFSKEFLDMSVDLEKQIVSGIVYSILDLDDIQEVIILVEGQLLKEYPNTHEASPSPLTRDIGINKEYSYTSFNDLTKVIVYYQEVIDDDTYYVPVTKYLNNHNNKDKIDIIIEELTTSYIYEDNLRSILNENVELIDKEIVDEDLLILNFNSALFDNNSTIKEEVLYTISYSAFANYSVNTISFRVDNKDIETVKRSSLT